MILFVIPLAKIYLGTKWFSAIFTFSLSEYPEISITSILSRSAGWIVSNELAVATKNTFERSNGVPR